MMTMATVNDDSDAFRNPNETVDISIGNNADLDDDETVPDADDNCPLIRILFS